MPPLFKQISLNLHLLKALGVSFVSLNDPRTIQQTDEQASRLKPEEIQLLLKSSAARKIYS